MHWWIFVCVYFMYCDTSYHNRKHYRFRKKKVRITKRAWLSYLHQFIIEVVVYSVNHRLKMLHSCGDEWRQNLSICSAPIGGGGSKMRIGTALMALSREATPALTPDLGFCGLSQRTALIHMHTGPWCY